MIDHSTTLAIHHDADLDGLTCREIARRTLPNALLLGYDYGDPVPDLTPYDTVYLLDISLPLPVMTEHAAKLIVIDHHATLIKAVQGLTFKDSYLIDGVAACRLAYQALVNGARPPKEAYLGAAATVVEPYAVRMLGFYDVWQKVTPEVDLFQFGMQGQQEPDWNLLLQPPGSAGPGSEHVLPHYLSTILDAGRAIHAYTTVTNAQIATERGFDVTWEGLSLRALCTARSNSLTFTAALKPHHDGCLSYFWDGGKWRFSLYGVPGKPDVDLSVIAKKYGGGGHKQAAGASWLVLPSELGGPCA